MCIRDSDTILVGWKAGGVTSHISVVDDFPLPVKALTWVQVTEGVPPQEYRFSLHEYDNVSSSPLQALQILKKQRRMLVVLLIMMWLKFMKIQILTLWLWTSYTVQKNLELAVRLNGL